MEKQSENPVEQHIFKKSPQELSSQVTSVHGTFLEFTKHPEGKDLDERYEQSRQYVEKLLEARISDEQLSEELGRLYEEEKNWEYMLQWKAKKVTNFSKRQKNIIVAGVIQMKKRTQKRVENS